jgi:density-regulated protein DRP1
VDLKKASKLLAQRFASVSKNPQGQGEIIIQGDVSYDLLEIVEDANEGASTSGLAGVSKDVPASNCVLVEDKKKKKDEE